MQTVSQLFEGYRAAVLPPTVPPFQVHACRRAFYAGVVAVLTEIMNSPDDISLEEREQQTLQLLIEVEAFSRSRT